MFFTLQGNGLNQSQWHQDAQQQSFDVTYQVGWIFPGRPEAMVATKPISEECRRRPILCIHSTKKSENDNRRGGPGIGARLNATPSISDGPGSEIAQHANHVGE